VDTNATYRADVPQTLPSCHHQTSQVLKTCEVWTSSPSTRVCNPVNHPDLPP